MKNFKKLIYKTGFKEENEIIPCGEVLEVSGENGIYEVDINIGTETGNTGINYNAKRIPDRFQLIFDGEIVADSKYVGETLATWSNVIMSGNPFILNTYKYSKGNFIKNTSKAEKEIIIEQNDIANGSYTEPTAKEGRLVFNKQKEEVTTMTLRVTVPTGNTAWDVETICPGEVIVNPRIHTHYLKHLTTPTAGNCTRYESRPVQTYRTIATTLEVGVTLYTDTQLLKKAANGYYYADGYEYRITQGNIVDKYRCSSEEEEEPKLTVTPTEITKPAVASKFNIDIESNLKWSISENLPWVTLTPEVTNLLRNSDKNASTDTYQMVTYNLGQNITQGTQVTLRIKGELGPNNNRLAVYNSGGSEYLTEIYPSNQDSNGIFRKTFNWNEGGTNNSIVIFQMPVGASHGSTIEWAMLTEDNVITDGETPVEPTQWQTVKEYRLDRRIRNGTRVTIQLKGNLGRDYFGIYANNGSTYVNELWPANETNGIFTKTFTWNGGNSSNLTLYQYGKEGTSTIEYLRLNEISNTEWISSPQDSTLKGEGNMRIDGEMTLNQGTQRNGSITVTGGEITRNIALTQQITPLSPIMVFGSGHDDTFTGADTADEAMELLNRRVIHATEELEDIDWGTVFYEDPGAFEIFNGGAKYFRLVDTELAVQIGLNGVVLEVGDTSVVITVSPETLSIDHTARDFSINVRSNTEWAMLSKPSWVIINGETTGSGNGSVSFSRQENPTMNSRTGNISFRASNIQRQAASVVTQRGIPDISISPENVAIQSSYGGIFELQITTSRTWTAQVFTEDPRFVLSQYTGSGNTKVNVTVPQNFLTYAVIHQIEVTVDGNRVLCNVTVPGDLN